MAAGDKNSPVQDFTSMDFASLLADLERFALAQTSTNFTNFNPSDPAMMLLRCIAYLGDMFGYNLNQLVKEVLPMLAVRTANFQAGVKVFGYVMKRRTPALLDLKFTVDWSQTVPVGGPITLPKSYQATTKQGVAFHPNGDTVVGPGAGILNVTVSGRQGQIIANEGVATSTGKASQRYALQNLPLLQDTLVLTVSAVAWTRVDPGQLALALSTDTVFSVEYSDDETAWIVFGDGINGVVPLVGAAIVASYDVGGGEAGNVDIDMVSQKVTQIPGVTTITNATRGSGGGEAQTVQNAQAALPGFVAANDRYVTDSDYASGAVTVPGILKAVAESGQLGGGGCGAPLILRAVPNGGGSLNATLIGNIQTQLKAKKQSGRRTIVENAVKVELLIAISVFVLPTGSAANTKALVQNIVADRFDLASVDFGDAYSLQNDVYDLLRRDLVKGVDHVSVETFTILPYADSYRNFPLSGNGTIQYIAYAGNVRREIMILVTSGGTSVIPGTFKVFERFIGKITELSDVSLTDEAATFPANNGLVDLVTPWYAIPNPYDPSSVSYQITGNTQTSITAVGGSDLRASGGVSDDYVVQHDTGTVGYVFRDSYAGPEAGGSTTLHMPKAGWIVGMKIRITDTQPSPTVFFAKITGGLAGTWTIDKPVPASGLVGTITVDAYCDVVGSVSLSFAMVQGSLNFGTGDRMYIDLYEAAEDVTVRPTLFPELLATNLSIRTIGGRA